MKLAKRIRAGLCLCALHISASWAAPIGFAGIGAAAQDYFEDDPLVSGQILIRGFSGSLDLVRDVPATRTLFQVSGFAGEPDPLGSHAETNTFRLGVDVAGMLQMFEVDFELREIANGQYMVSAFSLPVLSFDLGDLGLLTVTPDPAHMRGYQFLANTGGGGQLVNAAFLLTDRPPEPVPEPGALSLALAGVAALARLRVPRASMSTAVSD